MKSRPAQSKSSARPSRYVWGTIALVAVVGTGWVHAGDILRGGAGNGSSAAQRNATARSNSGSAEAAQASANARDRLARTTQAIQAVRNMQQKAGTATAVVPDGIQAGGLRVASGAYARWDGAALPQQSGNTVNIQQNSPQAVLHWESFNVGRKTTVNFDQSSGGSDSGKWIAFNKVFDPSGKPSQILGSIRADGQVYVINQNGIIFGAGSQVNTRSFVASSLPINDNLIQRGLLNQEKGNIQFLFSALPTGSFTPTAPLTANGRIGDVVVEPGAALSTSITPEGYGGRVMLVAPNVRNSGVISTPAGQTILAAGLQVGVNSHDSSDAHLRGLDVFVGAINSSTLGNYEAAAVNTGLIESVRGSIVMAGRQVKQSGILDSTTSVDVNGRIDLLANYNAVANQSYDATSTAFGAAFLFQSTGLVELSENSVTRILPEWNDSKTIARAVLPLRSQVNMQGQTIHFGKGATVLAPNAEVKLEAGEWVYQPTLTPPSSTFVLSSGQIYLDQGSLLDVSGSTNVFVSLAQSIITIQLRGSELADSPLQRDGLLRAVDLTVDLRQAGTYYGRDWVGTPLGDATGFLNLIERGVGQLTLEGGNITMRAGGSVVVQKGATLDASGGYAMNEGGYVQTSRLRLGPYLIDISDATPDQLYDGVYNGTSTHVSQKWGVTKKYQGTLAPLGGYSQQAFLTGANAGTISITAPSMALDGDMSSKVIIGPRQLRETSVSSNLPKLGRLELLFEGQDKNAPTLQFPKISPFPPSIVFAQGASPDSAPAFTVDAQNLAPALPSERSNLVVLSPDLLGDDGFGELVVRNSEGEVLVPSGLAWKAPAGGLLDISAANIAVEGSIFIPGGTVNLTAYNYSPYLAVYLAAQTGASLPPPTPGRGVISLASGQTISTAGLILDDRLTTTFDVPEPVVINGGKVALNAYSVDLARDSVLDVSGGVAYGARKGSAYGDAGSISVLAGQDPTLTAILGGTLRLGGQLLGFSGAGGGSLALKAPMIQIGGASSRENTLVLQPSFFNQGGFSKFELTGIGALDPSGAFLPGMLITEGTVIEPTVTSAVALPYDVSHAGAAAFSPLVKPLGVRDPVSLTFAALGAKDTFSNILVARGDVIFGQGAVIRSEPGATVSFTGETVSVLGSVFAPAGTINVTGASKFPLILPSPVALTTVYIGPNAILSAQGTTLLTPDAYGRRRGQVLDGGSINVSGNIMADAGALLDVSGTSGSLDLTPAELALSVAAPWNSGINAPLFSLQTRSTPIASNGGAITFKGGGMLAVESTLRGQAGGSSALGGTLSVSSGRFVPEGGSSTTADINLIVQQSGTFLSSASRGVGQALIAADGSTINGTGMFVADRFAAGGFSSLNLGGNIRFLGPISLNAEGAVLLGSGGIIQADSIVSVTAAYIRAGQEFQKPRLPTDEFFYFTQTDGAGATSEYKPVATGGSGQLNLSAPLLDVGTLVLHDISRANLAAFGGDIRGNGTFAMAGALTLTAGQIYPTTGADFNIYAYDHAGTPGSIRIIGSGVRPLPLSAGGHLNVMASVIHQGGTLRAPLGTISLGWDGLTTKPTNPVTSQATGAPAIPVTTLLTLAPGSITSVSAIDPVTGQDTIIPYGLSPDGLTWVDPSGVDITLSGLTAKQVNFGAQSLQMQAGSLVDVSGGGDLYAYRWKAGLGGTKDILASSDSFAIIPGYAFNYSPYAPFNPNATLLNGDTGYVNSSLSIGDQITLSASSGLPAGTYTLLPARYALMPGAFLVTPRSETISRTLYMEDGSVLTSGYISSSLSSKGHPATYSTFEVLDASVIPQRAEYEDYYANDFLLAAALAGEKTPQRLPSDAGRIGFYAQSALSLNGNVSARAAVGGRGSLIDIAALGNIWITGGGASAPVGSIVLDAGRLSSFGAESLLIGGIRDAAGTTLQVRSTNITLDNRGTSFAAPEIILAANQTVTLAAGSSIVSSGALTSGAASLKVTGDGALVRVSGDSAASILRSGYTTATNANLIIGDGAYIGGTSITLDSTYDTDLSPNAQIKGQVLNLNSGRLSFLLDNPGSVAPAFGLVLSGESLASLQSAGSLAFLSYSSTDFYGTGVLPINQSSSFILKTGEIRGFNQNGGTVVIRANDVLLDNTQAASTASNADSLDGRLEFDVHTFRLGSNTVTVNRFANVVVNASGGIYGAGTGGLLVRGDLGITTPALTAAAAAKQSITALGDLVIDSAGGAPVHASGLGASYNLTGRSVEVSSDIYLPSGLLSISATNGDVHIGGRFDLSGTAQSYYDVVRYTDGGTVSLSATGGDVVLGTSSLINVSAASGGGSAGQLAVTVPQGEFISHGALQAVGGSGGLNGSFILDTLALPTLATLNSILDAGSFTESRQIRVRTGNVLVDGIARSHTFALSTDSGDIDVIGTIDSRGETGGKISLSANGSVTLHAGSLLTVRGKTFNSAGKGGSVLIEAGTQKNGVVRSDAFLDVQAGSTIDLSVDSLVAGTSTTIGSSAFFGQFAGTLHLRAPQNAAGTDLQVNALLGTVTGGSSILVEGYKLYDLTSSGGQITGTRDSATALPTAGSIQRQVYDNGVQFVGAAGTASATYAAMLNRLLAGDAQGLSSLMVVAPGAELINTNGDLVLGSDATDHRSDWILSDYRFGTKKAAGVLTLRASGDLKFYNSLSDGFTPVATTAATGNSYLWLAPLMAEDGLRPANLQSYSFRLTAGADLTAASFSAIRKGSTGSVLLGRLAQDGGLNLPSNVGVSGTTAAAMAANKTYQVIRTGTGDIDIAAAGDVQLRNQFASIYTAGVGTPDRTRIFTAGDFVVPILNKAPAAGNLGANQQNYEAYYSYAGGNISLTAGVDIKRVTRDNAGLIIDDSSKQTPVNWLYRRGYVDPTTGLFGVGGVGAANNIGQNVLDASASTTWWVNYSNFFEGVGTLGGGNIFMQAGQDVKNVDAVAPTNARMAGRSNGVNMAPDEANLLEWGGGDITVIAGRDINGGVYYVERGLGTLSAGGEITTNATRSPSLGRLQSGVPEVYDSETWLPTTLFLGKGGFNVSARGDVLIGPAVNPFLLPSGLNNKYYYKTYFSTFDADSFLNVTSLGGDITHRLAVTQPGETIPQSVLSAWFSKMLLLDAGATTTQAYYYPWLRLVESSVAPFATTLSLSAPTLRSTAFSGDITLAGDLTLYPSSTGTLELVAAGQINGLAPTGISTTIVPGSSSQVWTSSQINLSDADPTSIPGITNPYAYHLLVGRSTQGNETRTGFLNFIDQMFAESGSVSGLYGVIQTQQALHAPGILHGNDPNPLRLYSFTGDISGLTLFASKKSQIMAGRDITDVSFYLQNVTGEDASIVSAGRDIQLVNFSTPSRILASSSGNALASGESPLAGDIQISGPGLLQVFAGRNLDLGTGANNPDGTGVGITSIGNARNPFLPFGGASLLVAAGLTSGDMDSTTFLEEYLGSKYAEELEDEFGSVGSLSDAQKDQLASRLLFLIMRDTGRAFANTGDYATGYAAIESLFSSIGGKGNINTRSRDIRTKSGGDISVLVPGGDLILAESLLGNPLTPPGIVSEYGGNVSIFTLGDVSIGQSRIFTLRGGNIVIWSSQGDIAAGAASKTVATAPPTRVLVDPQSATVETDLAGLATGGGIGVLSTVVGVPVGDVDLIAPEGTVDAGDAGIRVTGNLNIAATQVLNADNISVQGTSAGVPAAPSAAAPNIGSLTSASSATGATTSAADQAANQARQNTQSDEAFSNITVEVLGYGGGDDEDDERKKEG